jgi:hypothetical protein
MASLILDSLEIHNFRAFESPARSMYKSLLQHIVGIAYRHFKKLLLKMTSQKGYSFV